MSFYGVEVGDDLNKVYGHLEEVRLLYDKAGHQYFFGDNMVALSRNMAFAKDSPCLSGYHPHPLYVVCLLGLQARAGAGALRRRSG